MKQLIVAVLVFFTGIPIFGIEAGFLLNSVDMSRVTRKGAESKDEQSLAQIQAYLLETLFLKPLSDANKEVRESDDDDPENEGMGSFSDSENQQALMDRVFATHLAQQDLLRFKKLYLKKPVEVAKKTVDVPPSVYVAPYAMGRLSD